MTKFLIKPYTNAGEGARLCYDSETNTIYYLDYANIKKFVLRFDN